MSHTKITDSHVHSQRRNALAQTAAYCAAFIGLGLCGGSLGPSLAAHAARTGSDLSTISSVFVASALGRLCGSLSGGWLLDRTRGHTLMAIGALATAATMACIPFTGTLPAMLTVMFFYGIAVNWIDIGANTLIVRVHGDKVGPYMNALHLAFGIGGGMAPLIVGRSFALSGDVSLVYWFLAALLIPLVFWMLSLPNPPQVTQANRAQGATAPLGILLLLGTFFFLMVGVEITGAHWTFTLGERIGLSKEVGAPMLASSFWWAYSAGRLIAIPVSMRLRPGTYVAIDLIGALICAVITLVGLTMPNAQTLVWIGIAGSGIFIASAFPSALSFVGSRVPLSGAITGLLFASSNLGVMIVPWSIGQVIDGVGSRVVPITSMVASATAITIFAVLLRRLGKQNSV